MSQDDIFAQIANAGGLTDYPPDLQEGEHVLALKKCEMRSTLKYGRMFAVEFSVISSSHHQKGARVGDAFFVDKPGLEGDYAKKRVLAFGAAIVQGMGGSAEDLALCQKTLSEMVEPTQPWRGAQIRCTTSKKTSKKSGKLFDNNSYSPITQTIAVIQETRAALDNPAGVAVAPTPAPKPTILPPAVAVSSLIK